MPIGKIQLRDPRTTKTIELPSFKDSKVEIYPYLMMGDVGNLSVDDVKDPKKGLSLLPKLIKSWNFTDDKDQDIEVTEEALLKLPTEDVIFIFNQIEEFAKTQKKKFNDLGPLLIEMGWTEADLAECSPEYVSAIIRAFNLRNREIKRQSHHG